MIIRSITTSMTLTIAARATYLDFVKKVEPVNYYIKPRHTVSVLKVNNWEERLIDKCAKTINDDIALSLCNNKDVVFYVYILANNIRTKNLFYVCVDLHYDLK